MKRDYTNNIQEILASASRTGSISEQNCLAVARYITEAAIEFSRTTDLLITFQEEIVGLRKDINDDLKSNNEMLERISGLMIEQIK